jgi:hypothetical protein
MYLQPREETASGTVKCVGDRVKITRTAFAASAKGDTSISFNILLAGSVSGNAVPDIFNVDTDNSNATSSAKGDA